jgi:beta-galactosidase
MNKAINMKKLIYLFIFLSFYLFICEATAQSGTPYINAIKNEGRASYRTEFISYDIRKEAEAGTLAGSKYYRPMTFKLNTSARVTLFETSLDIPLMWLDRDVYLRDTGRTGRYRLKVNGREVGLNTDSYGTNDYYISPYLTEGINRFALEFTSDVPGAEMEAFSPDEKRLIIENLYIWSQPRIHIFDYTAAGYPNPDGPDAILALDIVWVNGYNTDEEITVGYDIYDPAGNLKDYTFQEIVVPGRGCDTVSFRSKIFGTEKYQYSADNPALYRVILSLKYGGRNIEYIPFKLGFGTTAFDGENATRNGRKIWISAVEQDAPAERNTLRRLNLMKRRGINTLYVTHPQQKWFYDMCEQNGIYIIDRAAVECDPLGDNRSLDGTVANNPAFRARFIDRQQNTFHRNKNRTNVIGWAIGSDSGNGYNMYKSYQWLKSADTLRMVVYPFARGEWNTDTELSEPKPLEEVLEGISSR